MQGRQLITLFVVGQLIFLPTYSWSRSASKRVAIVVTSSSATKTAENLTRVLSREGIEVIKPSTVRGKRAPATRNFRKGRSLLKAGKRYYEEMNFKAALSKLSAAMKHGDLDTVQEVFFNKALISHVQGKKVGALKNLEAYVIMGGANPDKAFYPPEFMLIHKKAKAKKRRRALATLSIRPRSEGNAQAEVFIDGKRLGETPYVARSVPVGPHFAKIVAPGHYPVYEFFYLPKKGKVLRNKLVSYSAQKLESEIKKARNSSQRSNLISLLQLETRTKGVLLIRRNRIQLFSKGNSEWERRVASSSIVSKNDAREIQSRLFSSGTMISNQMPVDQQGSSDSTLISMVTPEMQSTTTIKSGSRWYKKWWVWTIVGVAAAGAGSAVLLMGSGGGDPASTVPFTFGGARTSP